MTQPTVDYSRKWWVLISVSMGTFLSTIDGSIVNVALPTLEEELHTTFATVQWVVVAYLLVLTSMMLGVARLGDMIGKKKIYLTGMVVFTSASLLCGMAPSIGALIGFRVIQGSGAVMIQALGMGLVTEAFPSSERGRALGIIGTVVSIGISVGPTAGGVLIGAVGWRSIFLVNLPVGITGFFLVRRFVPDWRPPGGQRFDVWGALIMLVTLIMLALGLTFGPDTGWTSLSILALLIGSAVGFIVFVVVEMRIDQPMVDLRLFRDSLFTVSLITGFLVFVVIAGMFILPFYLERVKGFDTQATGLLLTVFPAALGVLAPISGALSDRYGPRGISLIGLAIFGLSCLTMAALKQSTSTWMYVLYMLPVGIGAGIFQSPNNSAIMGTARRDQLGVVSGLLSLSRNFGQVTGLPLIGAIYASRVLSVAHVSPGTTMDAGEAPPWAIVAGLHTAFVAAAVLIGVGVLLAGYAFVIEWRRRARAAEAIPTAQ